MEDTECLNAALSTAPNRKRVVKPLTLSRGNCSPSSNGSKLAQLFQFIDLKRTARKRITQQLSQRRFVETGPSLLSPDSPSNQPHRVRYRDIQNYQLFKRKMKLEAHALDTKFKVAFYKKLASPVRSNQLQGSFVAKTMPKTKKEVPSLANNQSLIGSFRNESPPKLTLEQHYTKLAFRDRAKRSVY